MSAANDSSRGTSLSLLERANLSEPASWQKIVDLYSPLVFFWCRQAGLQREDAADVLQNVWQAVSVHLNRFERQKPGGFRAWLWTITRNKLNDHFRRLRSEPAAPGGSSAQELLQELPEHEPQSYVAESHLEGSGNVMRKEPSAYSQQQPARRRCDGRWMRARE